MHPEHSVAVDSHMAQHSVLAHVAHRLGFADIHPVEVADIHPVVEVAVRFLLAPVVADIHPVEVAVRFLLVPEVEHIHPVVEVEHIHPAEVEHIHPAVEG